MASIEGLKAAADITKQIIALSTGAVAFTVTFLEKFQSRPQEPATLTSGLYVAWVLFGLTIFFALLNLMGITGTLECIDRKENGWDLTEQQQRAADGSTRHSRWAAILMFGFFLLAVIAMIWAGFTLGSER